MIYYALLAALGLQRLHELRIGTTNLSRVRHLLCEAPDQREARQMVALHAAWFLSCAAEFAARGKLIPFPFFLSGMLLLLGSQLVRFYSMQVLRESWIHLPVAYRGQPIYRGGLYRYLRHPNYWAVVVEIAVVPILGACWISAVSFSFLNALFVVRRVRKEEAQLSKASE